MMDQLLHCKPREDITKLQGRKYLKIDDMMTKAYKYIDNQLYKNSSNYHQMVIKIEIVEKIRWKLKRDDTLMTK